MTRFALAAALAAGVLVCAETTAFAQGCGGGSRSQMQGSPGGRSQMQGNPGGRSQLQGVPGGFSQMQTGGFASQLQAQQMYQTAQLRALQQQLSAAQLTSVSNQGYSNYARMYAAQQKRIAELRAGQ
jgi:hypothetical protein